MSLNNIQLPASLVFDMYENMLTDVLLTEKPLPEMITEADENTLKYPAGFTWPVLGKNGNKVLVVVHYENVMTIPDEQLQFLTRMLDACGQSLAEVAIINLTNYAEVVYTSILTHFEAQKVLLFGVTASQFGFPFSIPDHQIQHHNNYTIIQASELSELDADRASKMELWPKLKIIFEV